MSSTPPSDETTAPPPAGPVLFQAPRPGPGRPSSTSTSAPPRSGTTETSPSDLAESSTGPEPDWSTRSHPDVDDARPESGTSSGSLGSEAAAEALTGLRGRIAAGIANGTQAAHHALADDVGQAFGQFLASEKEIEEVSDAGARILSRKLPKGLGNPDLEDAIRVGIAVVSYVSRQLSILKQARAARHQLKAAAAAAPRTGDQAV